MASERPRNIALVSGKGGSGKTSVAIAMGYLLSDLGFRVALVDADTATRGMSYFFSEYLDRLSTGLADGHFHHYRLRGEDGQPGELTFSPLVGPLSRDIQDRDVRRMVEELSGARWLEFAFSGFDFVLLDCQAGVGPLVTAVLKASDTALVVTEADPISVFAVNVFRRQVERDLASNELRGGFRGIVNKILPEEEQYYEALVDVSREIRFLGSLPFDASVRRAFFRRQAPVDLNAPSPMTLALLGALEGLDGRVAAVLRERDDYLVENEMDRAAEVLRELFAEREALLDRLVWAESRRTRATAVRLAALSSLALLTSVLTYAGALSDWPVDPVVTIVGVSAVLMMAIAVYYTSSARNRILIDIQREELSARLRQLDERIDEYRVVVASGRHQLPRSP